MQANKAAIKAFILNRIGDVGFTLGILLIFSKFQTVDFAVIFVLAPYFSACTMVLVDLKFGSFHVLVTAGLLNMVCLLLFIGTVGKSAQVGLHT